MRIAQVAPLYESVPPQLYGGTERVVSYLTGELVRMGHEVTLFASGDSQTRAKLVAACPQSLWRNPDCCETLPPPRPLDGPALASRSAVSTNVYASPVPTCPLRLVNCGFTT